MPTAESAIILFWGGRIIWVTQISFSVKIFTAYRLPLAFDPDRLKVDLAKVASQDWTGHFEKLHYEGGWDGAALRSFDGETGTLKAGGRDCQDTELLRLCPYFREVVSEFKCKMRRVRLLRLAAGARIKKHVDYQQSYDHGFVRLHIPIESNSKVEFYVDGIQVILGEGECWYVNASYPHKVFNGGDRDRIHLVLDCEVNDWLRSKFPESFNKKSRWRMAGYRFRWNRYKARDFAIEFYQDLKSFLERQKKYLNLGLITNKQARQ